VVVVVAVLAGLESEEGRKAPVRGGGCKEEDAKGMGLLSASGRCCIDAAPNKPSPPLLLIVFVALPRCCNHASTTPPAG
jgi:hypothetical protein